MTHAYTILIVDDSDDDQELFDRFLRDDPTILDIHAARTGADGIKAYQAKRPDCVLLNYDLPDQNGLEVLRLLKALDQFATVVLTTGEGDHDLATQAIKTGATDYVAKHELSPFGLHRSVMRSIESTAMQQCLAKQEAEQKLFIDTLLHDLRAPLRQVRLFADQLVDDLRTGDYDEVQEQGVSIAEAATRMQNLIKTLAAYALSEKTVSFTMIDMGDVAEAAISNLADRIEDRRALIDLDGLPHVKGSHPQLIQLLQNLISNALKYNQSERPHIAISGRQQREDSDSWLFEVRDNGIGIPPDRLDYVFEPFKRLWSHDDFEGTGLGLAICKKIVERHDGRIWCRSDGHHGSSFFFSLARSNQAQPSAIPLSTRRPGMEPQEIQVLNA